MSASDTSAQLLDVAGALVQERGYNAFSYKDLAEAVGIRAASIHYHFPAKADLGVALVERYTAELERALAEIDRGGRTAVARLKRFLETYAETEAQGAICLCGSLAADRETLPAPLQDAVEAYLDRSEAWVAATIHGGVREGELTFEGKPAEAAAALLASLQGALILARARGGTSSLAAVRRVFLRTLGAS